MSELSCDTLFIGRNETHDLSRYQMLRYPWPCMRIPHPVPVSFPPRGAHEKISSTCAKIPTILSTFFSGLVEEKSVHLVAYLISRGNGHLDQLFHFREFCIACHRRHAAR